MRKYSKRKQQSLIVFKVRRTSRGLERIERTMLETGTKAPAFTLPDQNGEMRSLSDYKGKKVILYFYPKDMTSGCTKQACAYGELMPQFREDLLLPRKM